MIHVFDKVICPKGYRRSTPSILPINDDTFLVIVRLVNYTIQNDHNYVPSEGFSEIRTENVLLRCNINGEILDQKQIKDGTQRTISSNKICGFEDMRFVSRSDLTKVPSSVFVTCTCADAESHGMPQTMLLVLDVESATVTKAVLLKPGFQDTKQKEKNWLPFWNERLNQLQVIYKHEPLTIHTIDPDTGDFTVFSEHTAHVPCPRALTPTDIASFRGSAGPIRWGNGYLYLVHTVTYEPKWVYKHRFVWMTEDFRLQHCSNPFNLFREGIEFACGLAKKDQDHVIVTFSVRDGEAYAITYPNKTIERMLQMSTN